MKAKHVKYVLNSKFNGWVSSIEESVTYKFFDMTGRNVHEVFLDAKPGGNVETVSLNHLRAGTYLYIATGTDWRSSDKLVILK